MLRGHMQADGRRTYTIRAASNIKSRATWVAVHENTERAPSVSCTSWAYCAPTFGAVADRIHEYASHYGISLD